MSQIDFTPINQNNVTLPELGHGALWLDEDFNFKYKDSNGNIYVFGSSSNIGPAEDGTYTDGLFTDFIPATPIGVPIDRFNELFKALVPPFAPFLNDYNALHDNDTVGKLSFDATYNIPGYEESPLSRNSSWLISGKRLGIIGEFYGDIYGDLNYNVAADTSVPTPAYVAKSFSDAELGTLELYLNGNLINSVDLTNLNAIDTTSGGVDSGFNLSAAVPSYFPQGAPLDVISTRNRTGTYLVKDTSVFINGYNYIYVKHDLGNGTVRILDIIEFIQDDDVTDTEYSNEMLYNLQMTGSKYLSGIEYYTAGTAKYDFTVSNAYRNTYNLDSDAISYTCLHSSTTNESIPNLTSTDDYENDIDISNKTITIDSNIRLLNESISVLPFVKRVLQNDNPATIQEIHNILMDDIDETSTLLIEDFNGESYRLIPLTYDDYNTIPTSQFDSTENINDSGSVNYNNALQIIDDKIIYPGNSSYYSNFTIITNGPAGNPDYSDCHGERNYVRYFRQISPTTANFIINIQGSGGTFVPHDTVLTGNNIHLYFKVPGDGSALTGWLDAYNDFATANWNDDDGCRNASAGTGRNFNTNWGLTIGTKNTANSNGYIVIKIEVGEDFTGEITKINFLFQ